MQNYLVLRIKGKQYFAYEGKELLCELFNDSNYRPEVLLSVKEGKVSIGKPILKDASFKFKILEESEKGKKITTLKYKAKSRYRKKIGFRPRHTRLLVEEI